MCQIKAQLLCHLLQPATRQLLLTPYKDNSANKMFISLHNLYSNFRLKISTHLCYKESTSAANNWQSFPQNFRVFANALYIKENTHKKHKFKQVWFSTQMTTCTIITNMTTSSSSRKLTNQKTSICTLQK
mgnify:CR=1 FL=1